MAARAGLIGAAVAFGLDAGERGAGWSVIRGEATAAGVAAERVGLGCCVFAGMPITGTLLGFVPELVERLVRSDFFSVAAPLALLDGPEPMTIGADPTFALVPPFLARRFAALNALRALFRAFFAAF
ncbi:MAG: hypothetical protein IPL39_14875 [Opitutaceae bacterium]|nr:hypothetical protein [Opitutaceae bacterium]